MKTGLISLMLSLLSVGLQAAGENAVRPGQLWPDTDGHHINAHGGGVLLHEGTFYWFGEHKSDRTSAALVGITCYSSTDLLHWQNRGVALSVSQEKGADLERGCIMERPKVIYNAKTKTFVMWFHLELRHRGYDAARFAVAVSDKPEGPYTFLYSSRANAGQWPMEFTEQDIQRARQLHMRDYKEWWTPEWYKAVGEGLFVNHDFEGGQMSRDMTLYVDSDSTAYHIFASEDNLTLHIAELTPDYLHHTGRYTRVAPAGHNEAPTLFRHRGTYWMITSGCTGWDPNEARMFSAPSIWGPWTQHPNPCVGPMAEKTFGAQGTFVLSLPNGQYIFMADIWRPRHPSDARYVWLPITFEEGLPVVRWQDAWTPAPVFSHSRIRKDVPLDDIRLSDPAILADQKTHMYYMTGTGGMMWRSPDLKRWEGPFRVTEFDKDSWMGPRPMIWAAELHQTGDGRYYYFATFTNQAVKIDTVRGNVIERRASQVLRADDPMGPYRAFGDATYLPADRPTLDGTFWRDLDGKPYMVFCGEWLQNWNGTIEKIELKPDLSGTIGQPKVLFRASDSPWSREVTPQGDTTWNKVTDGPWLFRTATGRLGMLWTSWVEDVYTQGVAYSASGTLNGPWIHEPEPITPPGYGHSMLFQTFEGQWMMSVHLHQKDARGRTVRTPHLFPIDLSGDKLRVLP